jgi:hypothetical protein
MRWYDMFPSSDVFASRGKGSTKKPAGVTGSIPIRTFGPIYPQSSSA